MILSILIFLINKNIYVSIILVLTTLRQNNALLLRRVQNSYAYKRQKLISCQISYAFHYGELVMSDGYIIHVQMVLKIYCLCGTKKRSTTIIMYIEIFGQHLKSRIRCTVINVYVSCNLNDKVVL